MANQVQCADCLRWIDADKSHTCKQQIAANKKQPKNKELQVIQSSRDVIGRKLLSALDDNGQVAILATEEDLVMLISALYVYPEPRALEWARDLTRLRQESFGK